MIRHIVLLTWQPGTTGSEHEAVVAALRALPAQIPELRRYRVGSDLALAEGNAHLAVIADFDTVADYEVYRDHAAHQHVIRTLIRPILASRTAVQYDFDHADD